LIAQTSAEGMLSEGKPDKLMKNLLEPHDRDFLDHLNRMGSGTVGEICGKLGVTATAVRQRLLRLQSLNFIQRETIRSGRGRPYHAYSVTPAGQQELGDNYSDLAMILWRELRQIEDPAVRELIFARIREALVHRYGHLVHAESLDERFRQLGKALLDRGFHVEVDSSGRLPILRENNCPYLELASTDPAICELEKEVFRKVLGSEVELTQCCLDGHSCCEFQPVSAER
jgi:predicted ArsR family transcriptional regulator